MPDLPMVPQGLDMEPRHWAIVQQILTQHLPGLPVWAFGSRTKGTAKPHSDLDLAVITTEPLSLQQAACVAEAFSESDLPWRVDVVDWALTSEAFRCLIKTHCVVVQALASGRQ
jgi:predicted nucleotidyltransferase